MRFVGIDRAMWSLGFAATQHIAHACGAATERNSAEGKSFRKRVKEFPARLSSRWGASFRRYWAGFIRSDLTGFLYHSDSTCSAGLRRGVKSPSLMPPRSRSLYHFHQYRP